MSNLIFFGGDLYRQALIFIIIIMMMVVVPSMPTVLVAIVIGLVVITAIVAWIHRIVTVLISTPVLHRYQCQLSIRQGSKRPVLWPLGTEEEFSSFNHDLFM